MIVEPEWVGDWDGAIDDLLRVEDARHRRRMQVERARSASFAKIWRLGLSASVLVFLGWTIVAHPESSAWAIGIFGSLVATIALGSGSGSRSGKSGREPP